MRWLALALCVVASSVGAVTYSPAPTALFDVEQNVSDTAGSNHGTAVSTTYGTTGAWSGTYAANGGYFSVPTSLVGISGTAEFSYRTAASPANSKGLFGIGHSTQRALEIYQFGGSLYAFDAYAGVNAAFFSYSANTNYYIKQTWNASRRIIYVGTWTTPGSVTLTKVTDVATTYLSGTINGINCRAAFGVPETDGAMDFFAFRNVFDDSATIIAPVSSTHPQQASPDMRNINSPNVMPKLLMFLKELFVSKAYALSVNQTAEQDWNEYQLWRAEQLRATKTPTPAPTPTPNPSWTKTATPAPSPTATPTRVP